MGTRKLACPTCGTMEDFRLLTEAEKTAVREDKGAGYRVDNLWRCTAEGCLSYYRHLNKNDGGRLPDKFREEKAAEN
ncbi:hypothetical protein AB0G67_07070 [Streptomyces sp. NPDC021056]|uniref:hypothetical protein n=1 Tax=unclassified Streptomyces TaxID=2593676 RepID=UPI0033D1F5D6